MREGFHERTRPATSTAGCGGKTGPKNLVLQIFFYKKKKPCECCLSASVLDVEQELSFPTALCVGVRVNSLKRSWSKLHLREIQHYLRNGLLLWLFSIGTIRFNI